MSSSSPSQEDLARTGLIGRAQSVAEQVRSAASAAGRSPGDVRLLMATKTIPAPVILDVMAAGFGLIGENRAQEVVAKADRLAAGGVSFECHFIGHLQSNKVNQVLPHITCVQTVDSAELASRIDSRLRTVGGTLDVMLQVNVSEEPSKSGVTLQLLPALLGRLAGFSRLRVTGYMTIGLNSPDVAAVRAGYRSLATFRDDASRRGLPGAEGATGLSMGMSADFADAIAEGATIVRVGSAVFGSRPPIGPPSTGSTG